MRKEEDCGNGGSCAVMHLEDVEEDYLCLVAEGNLSQLKHFLKKHSKIEGYDFDVNCVDYKNESAIDLALDKRNTDMLQFLAGIMNMTKNDILLKAIHIGDLDVVTFLCETMDADREALEGDFAKQTGVPDYPSTMSPLMLASIEGFIDIVGYLLDRNHSILEPHKPGCLCEEVCLKIIKFVDPLELAWSTLLVYQTMASPAYFLYTTACPFHYAFKLHRRLMKMSICEHAYSRQYQETAQNLAHFSAMLVAECRTIEELHHVLRRANKPKSKLKALSLGEFPRLEMALEYDQKEFVIQPNVQMFIQDKFYGTFEDWMYYSNVSKICYPFLRMFTIPSAFFSCLMYPSSKSAKFYASPINRMLHYLATYFIFLFVLLFENRREKPAEHECGMISVWTGSICLYFVGLVGVLISQSMSAGFWAFPWNLYDIVMCGLFFLFMAFNVSSQIHIRMSGTTLRERAYWSGIDPQLLAEGVLVLATIMAFLKLFMFSQAHKVLGPLQVSVCRMVKEFIRYSIYGVAVLFTFSIAYSKFYDYYSGRSFLDPVTMERSVQDESFVDVTATFKTYFWGIFGLSEIENADVILENANDHMFTQLVGYIGLATFSLLMILVVKNMITAIMVKTHQNMYGDYLRKAWLFRRTQIFMYFMTFPVLPPPFNLLPSLYNRRYLREKLDIEEACEAQGFDYDCQYLNLVKILVVRYYNRLGKKKACEQTFPPTTSLGDGEKKNVEKGRCRSM